jgi:hypothetical protein
VREHLTGTGDETDYSNLSYFAKFREVLSGFDEPGAVYILGEFAQFSTFSSCIRSVWSRTKIVCQTDPKLWLLGGLVPPQKPNWLNGTILVKPSTVAYDFLVPGQPPLLVRKGEFVSCDPPHWLPYDHGVLFVAEGREVTIGYRDLVTSTLRPLRDLYAANEESPVDPTSATIELHFCQSAALDAPDLTDAYVRFASSEGDDPLPRFRLKVKQSILEAIWPRTTHIRQFAKAMSPPGNARNYSRELTNFVRSLEHKALHNIEFKAITTDEERSEIIAAISVVQAKDPKVQLKTLKKKFGPLLARYSDHMEKQPELVDLYQRLKEARQYLSEGSVSNEAIAALNLSLPALRAFCRRAPSDTSVTVRDAEQATSTLNRALDAVRGLTPGFAIEVGPDGKLNEASTKILEEMGVTVPDSEEETDNEEDDLMPLLPEVDEDVDEETESDDIPDDF